MAASPLLTTGAEDPLVRYCNHLDLPLNFQAICVDVIMLADDHSFISVAGYRLGGMRHLL